MNIAIVGATGLVGQVILELLEKFEFNFDNVYAIASKKSIGKSIKFRDQEITIISVGTKAISKELVPEPPLSDKYLEYVR